MCLLYLRKAVEVLTRDELKEKVKLLPFAPGIYMMKDKNGKIIYVGKSKCLHNRVSHYFMPYETLDIKTRKLSSNIYDFECIYTASEAEALILENELIKRHTPKYNIKLKDAKTYPYVRLDMSKPYPKIGISRTRHGDKAVYFGPYTSTQNAREIIDTVCKTFKIDTCGKDFEYGKRLCRPCLFYHIGQCMGACSGNVTSAEYRDVYSDVERFLKGDYKEVINELTGKMNACAERMEFENAAKLRDRITALAKLEEHQNIITNPEKEFDVFGTFLGDTLGAVSIIFIRNGKVIDKDDYLFSSLEICDDYSLCDFIERFYKHCGHIPQNILLSFDIPQEMLVELSENLSAACGAKVKISVPERGEKKVYAGMAAHNASESVRQKLEMTKKDEDILVRLASLLHLEVVPDRIEAYDISNNGKDDMYCGMIVLENGRFKKSDYRVFSIKSLNGTTDDYAAMQEAIGRRLTYLVCPDKSNPSYSQRPDLILLDGGVGHVNTIKKLEEDMGLDIPLVGMIKDDFHKTRTLTDGENELGIAGDMSLFTFIYGIQEEVHRFTFSKMDASRNKKMKHSSLEKIPGVGEARAKALMKHFKSLTAIKNATEEELCSAEGISKSCAAEIVRYFKEQNPGNSDNT